MTDVNSIPYQSTSPHLSDDENHSFVLNESNVPMDIDDQHFIANGPTKVNGHISPTIDENETEQNLSRNPVLNKSFDVLPQTKDDDEISIVDQEKKSDVLDTTVELPNHLDESINAQPLLSNQFSLEYPYVVPQPVENVRSSSPEAIQTMTTLTKAMKLNPNNQSSTDEIKAKVDELLTNNNEKTFDTNTFVLKKKERRKIVSNTENHSNDEQITKISPAATPSASIDTTKSVAATLVDPTRIM